MGRAYSIRPYSIGDFPGTFDYNYGLSSYPQMASRTLSGAEGESNPILVHSQILVYPPIHSILVQTPAPRPKSPNPFCLLFMQIFH